MFRIVLDTLSLQNIFTDFIQLTSFSLAPASRRNLLAVASLFMEISLQGKNAPVTLVLVTMIILSVHKQIAILIYRSVYISLVNLTVIFERKSWFLIYE